MKKMNLKLILKYACGKMYAFIYAAMEIEFTYVYLVLCAGKNAALLCSLKRTSWTWFNLSYVSS